PANDDAAETIASAVLAGATLPGGEPIARAMLLRERIVLDPSSRPMRSGTFSQAWPLERTPSGLETASFLFDRARARDGLDPWREKRGADIVRIIDPESGEPREGAVSELCGSCHTEEAPFRSVEGDPPVLVPFDPRPGEPVPELPVRTESGAGTETGTGPGAETETGTETESGAETEPETGTGTESGAETEAGAGAGIGPQRGKDADARAGRGA